MIDQSTELPERAAFLVARDREHKRKTANTIEDYAEMFHQSPDELLAGEVLNIGDPFRVLGRQYRQVMTVDYEYPDPRQVFPKGIPERIQELLEVTDDRFIEGPFPWITQQLPGESFDRILAHKSLSMHSFAEYEAGDFLEVWDEIVRLLRPGGRAYIGPLQTDLGGRFDDEMLHQLTTPTLNDLRDEGIIDFRIVHNYDPDRNQPLIVPNAPDCLVIEKLDSNGESSLGELFPQSKYAHLPGFDDRREIEALPETT